MKATAEMNIESVQASQRVSKISITGNTKNDYSLKLPSQNSLFLSGWKETSKAARLSKFGELT